MPQPNFGWGMPQGGYQTPPLQPPPLVPRSSTPCDPLPNEDPEETPFSGMSGQDEAIYELFYSNPIKSCGTVVEITDGPGLDKSPSLFFQTALNWNTILISGTLEDRLDVWEDRAKATVVPGVFCDHDLLYYKNDKYYAIGGEAEVSSELHEPTTLTNLAGAAKVDCLSLETVYANAGITRTDVIFISIPGDVLSVIRAMDWRVRTDVWVIQFGGPFPEREEKVRFYLEANQYIKAAWDIKRWCDSEKLQQCMPNEVYLKKGFVPLPEVQARIGRRLDVRDARIRSGQ